MDKSQILETLQDWNLWKKEIDAGTKRKDYLYQALKFIKPNVILAIIGIRRSGKSYLMRQLAKELIEGGAEKSSILMVNFEDKRFTEFNIGLLDMIYETYMGALKPKTIPFIFLDEIHKIPQWERWARTFHELGKAKIIISSSSANLMSGELATLLTGRHLDIRVFPLTFHEFLYFKGMDIENKLDLAANKISIKGFFSEYMEYGGFPEVVLNEEKKQLLLTYFDDILTKDIEKRYHVREGEKLRSLARFYLTNISNHITFNSLKKHLELSADTIEKFSSYFEEANIIFFVKRFSFKVKDQDKAARKVYSTDIGLANAVGFRFSSNLGKIAENMVASKLNKMKALDSNIEVYYWNDLQKREVDFLVKKAQKPERLIQVCWNIEAYKTKEREIKALLKAAKELKCKDLMVITDDFEGEEIIDERKIRYLPLWRWLLEDSG